MLDNKYSAEQKRAWADMIELGKHNQSLSHPKSAFLSLPHLKFHQYHRIHHHIIHHQLTCTNTQSAAVCLAHQLPLSACWLHHLDVELACIHSECIDQLQKWHSLLDFGAITKEQYDEVQGTILSDIRNL